MARSEIEKMLRRWIEQAGTAPCRPAEGEDSAEWVTEQFVTWWRKHLEETLREAESATQRLRDRLIRAGDPRGLDDAMHETMHVQDSLAAIRSKLGLAESEDAGEELTR